MSIQEFSSAMSDPEIDRLVNKVLSSLGTTARDFEHASREYNSDFFQDEPDEFRRRLCRALQLHFKHVGTNTFWNKNAE
jgi:hypothetical protein